MDGDIAFTLNGDGVVARAAPTTPLLYVLRNEFGLRATRHGCGEGDCGACTVLVDGRPVTACTTPVESVAERGVETVEGLAASTPPHPLIDAVLSEQAGQCGYCLAGILMRAAALLARDDSPSRRDIAAALDDNLCRCGAHNRILRAVERAAASLRGSAAP